MSEIRNALRAEFPHALAAIDMMLVDLRDDEPVAFRPFVLLGDAGCGKSRLVRRLLSCWICGCAVMTPRDPPTTPLPARRSAGIARDAMLSLAGRSRVGRRQSDGFGGR